MNKLMVLAAMALVLGGCATQGQRVVFVPARAVVPTTVVVAEPQQQQQIVYAPTSGYYQRDGYRHNSGYGVDDLVRLGNQSRREENRHEESMTRIKVQALNNAGRQIQGVIKDCRQDRRPSYRTSPPPRHDQGRQSDHRPSRPTSPRRQR